MGARMYHGEELVEWAQKVSSSRGPGADDVDRLHFSGARSGGQTRSPPCSLRIPGALADEDM